MVNSNAIVNIVQRISDKNSSPCKKTLQKIVYLIEAKGIDIGCDYGIHFYGPYSADLDFAVRELVDEGILDIEYTDTKHLISVNDGVEVSSFNNEIANHVIDAFADKSPNMLELITTALYVYRQSNDVEAVEPGVVKIKGTKYNKAQIEEAISCLRTEGYIR